MNVSADAILANLKIVDAERERRSVNATLNAKVLALKAFQQSRFSHTYADLLTTARYGAASRFFLDELYGPMDFSRRDAQFARIVPALVRLFPHEVVATVAALGELHALSERLDSATAACLAAAQVTPREYIRVWQAAGQAAARQAQIDLTLDVASQLDQFTRKPLLRNSLRLMRGPARAAGMAELQKFLETGFDSFRTMKGAEEFITLVASRERALAFALFEAALDEPDPQRSVERALAKLPSS